MRRYSLLILLLLAASSTVLSQSFRLDVLNEPMSNVLNTLGIEISFDDQVFSEYNVSFSGSFENREKALLWLLQNKPFRIEKMNNVYIIVPHNEKQKQETTSMSMEVEKKRFVYRGTVVSQDTGEYLEYAAVSFLDDDNRPLIYGITTGNGQFDIQSPSVPTKIKISYIGYETLLKDINNTLNPQATII